MPVFRVPIELSWTGPGSPGLNVWSLRAADDTAPEAQVAAGIGALQTFYTALQGCYANGISIKLGDVTNRETQELVSAPAWTPITNTATDSAAPVLQMCVSWRTSLKARRGMGRTFIGPVNRAVEQTDGTISESYRTAIQDAVDDLVAASQGNVNGWALGVWGLQSPAPAGATNTSALPRVHRDFVRGVVRDQFAVLRSRRD